VGVGKARRNGSGPARDSERRCAPYDLLGPVSYHDGQCIGSSSLWWTCRQSCRNIQAGQKLRDKENGCSGQVSGLHPSVWGS
jgi:hypothetical protein